MNPHDDPSAAALTEAVREFLERDVLPATDGRVRFHTRVAINVLGMIERELLRSGALDDRLDEVTAVVRETVAAKLEVANPRYLGDGLDRLHTHLRHWLGHWPAAPGEVVVVGSPFRVGPGWDGRTRPFIGVASPEGVVLSVPPGAEGAVERLGLARQRLLSELGDGDGLGDELARTVGGGGGRLARGCFRWSVRPAELEDAGEWLPVSDPRVPSWLHPFNGDVLVAWDDEGKYGAGVGRKQHDRWGHELAVVTEEALRGRGIARRRLFRETAQPDRRRRSHGPAESLARGAERGARLLARSASGKRSRR